MLCLAAKMRTAGGVAQKQSNAVSFSMLQRPRLLSLVQIERVTRTLFFLLLVSLLMLLDGYVLVLVSRSLGIYLLLAVEATTGLVGVLLIRNSYGHVLEQLRREVHDGRYPAREFRLIGCLIVSALCLIVPGFATDAVGLLALLPPLRWLVGYAIERTGRAGLEELYEYVKLEEE